MEEFKGASRATTRTKAVTGKWQFARNILLSKGFSSITNEEGFDYKHEIPGKFIGKIDTNEEIVYFSLDGEFSCIGIYRTIDPIPVYIPILRSRYLKFKLNRPIEGVFFYNFKKELIVAFCDGVFEDSNTPKLINLSNLGIDLSVDLELINVNDINLLELFPNTIEGRIEIRYGNTTNLEIDIVYVTFAYVYADNISTTAFYPVYHIAYPTYMWTDEDRRTVIIDLFNLDINFNSIKLGLIVNSDNGLIGYTSPLIAYANQQATITIDSLSSYDTIAVEDLVIGTIYYNRIKTLTLQNNQLVAGHLVAETELKLQKYLNRLEVGLKYVTDQDEKWTHPTLLPDEVYSIYAQPQYLSGEYGRAHPLIGPKNTNPEELLPITQDYINTLGLNTLDISQSYKKFHIENSGKFTLDPPYIETDDLHNDLTWGYWENEDTYPNNEEFNSTTDYDNTPLVGEDYRNTPIRLFRVPGLDAINAKIPCILGFTEKNDEKIYGETQDRFLGRVPRFGVFLKNFEEAIPEEVRKSLQGIRLLIVKRKTGDRLVEDISFMKQIHEIDMDVEGNTYPSYFTSSLEPRNSISYQRYTQFGVSKLWSNLLYTFKPQINSKIIKANYAVRQFKLTDDSGDVEAKLSNTGLYVNFANKDSLDNIEIFKIKPQQKFAEIKDLKYLPGNNITAKTPFIEDTIYIETKNHLEVQGIGTPNLQENRWNPLQIITGGLGAENNSCIIPKYNPFTRLYEDVQIAGDFPASDEVYQLSVNYSILNLQKNLYAGFNPTDFIILGRLAILDGELDNQVLSDNGDIFTNNILKFPTTYTKTVIEPTNYIRFKEVFIKGAWSVNNNSSVYITKDRVYNGGNFSYLTSGPDSDSAELSTFNYNMTQFGSSTLNDLIAIIAFNVNSPYINYFPYRVARTPKIPNENLQTNVIRTFKANSYYEMPNNKGEIISVRGSNKQLYIQQKYSLFIARIKDILSTTVENVYLGEGDIFDRIPDEILDESNKGYIGCTSQFASDTFKDGYIVVDQVKGKIFVVSNGVTEISSIDMAQYFRNNWEVSNNYYNLDRFGNKQKIDNPYTQVGHIIGYDEDYNRLFFTKKSYVFKFEEEIDQGIYTFDGEWYYENDLKLDYNNIEFFTEISITWSYDLYDKVWVCEHDYFPNSYSYTSTGLFLITNKSINAKTYQHNSKTQKGYFFEEKFESYVDLIFNSRYDLSKLYQAVEWGTEVIAEDGSRKYFKTIDKIMLYNDYQCTGIINIPDNTFKISRNKENVWNFNSFRDMVIDRYFPIIDEEGRVNQNNINFNKSFFDKSNFIDIFIVVRLIISNETNDTVYIHRVNVKSRISDK